MTTTEEFDTAVLYSLLLKGRASTSSIAAAIGATEDATATLLEASAAKGLVLLRTGRISGWLLTPEGRAHVGDRIDTEKSAVDRATMGALYDDEFLRLNSRFKELCTHWQLKGGNVESELTRIHEANLVLLERFTTSAPRFARYVPRFVGAYDRFSGGDATALLQPMRESYHDVWLELHEDLLILLDRQREEGD
ncbi:hypothetical protein LZG04_03900 [Saccharothrix sp. S26]|uniref:hypothetical protein n=1 Tax=Saccharothrix sp. S26 TaxID=2907215 RepID=UPI001F2741A1|nr:hypothetical protein [Saccharothrix sp. S26]MCE6993958.1 hypothetical protein [Saccharothrix sp. S26]